MGGMTRSCQYHCRRCGGHFASLKAFDAHREGPVSGECECTYPDDSRLVELTGTCEIGDPTTPKINVTLYAEEMTESRQASLDALRQRAA
jgi:hypothetical protein